MKKILMTALLPGALFLAACSPTSPTSTAVRPIEEVTADQPPQMTEITSHDAVLVFESSVPLACSVVYGETTEYGMIATDTDMAGGAHSDHSPFITGLEPDTEYHFQVQGAGADGTLYRSGDFTFRTPAEPADVETNWASVEEGAEIVDVSSNFGGAAIDERWGALSAIDGNRGTTWASDGDGNDAYLEIQLANKIQLEAIEVWSHSMADGSARVTSFQLITERGESLGPFALEAEEGSQRFDVDGEAQQIRFEVVESTGGNTGLVEFAVYGEPVEGDR